MTKYYAVNYNTLNVFDTKRDLIDFYKGCAMCSEGHEQHRYMQVLMEILDGNIGTDIEDKLDENVWTIYVHNGNKTKRIDIDKVNYKQAIKNYEEGLYE